VEKRVKVEVEVTWRGVLKAAVACFLVFLVAFAGFTAGVNMAYPVALKKGYEQALTDMSEVLKQKGAELEWEDLGSGRYKIKVLQNGALVYQTAFEIHLLVQHFDRYGNLVSESSHPMTVVNQGKDWVEQQLFNPSATQKAIYLACSNDSSSVSTIWTALPNEITTGGLARAAGTYTSTGVGAANVTYTFSVTATASTKLYGVYWDSYSNNVNSLIAAEQQGTANQKNLNSGDQLKLTVQWSHS
jgi:hypothetical protein